MKEGSVHYFCNCLLQNFKDHITAVDNEGCCLYCKHHAVQRKATESDVRGNIKWNDRLQAAKMEHLKILIKDKRHQEKVQ